MVSVILRSLVKLSLLNSRPLSTSRSAVNIQPHILMLLLMILKYFTISGDPILAALKRLKPWKSDGSDHDSGHFF